MNQELIWTTSSLNKQYQDNPADFLFRLREDPWFFLHFVNTLDQVDKGQPVKPFPVHLDYLKHYVSLWVKESLILVPKSRRMKMSWVNISLYLWDAMFHIGRRHALVSKKEEDADDLVERAKFILENLSEDLPKEFIPAWKKTYCSLEFTGINSVLEAYPSGADQLRQFTFSGILGDEMAFWDNAQQMYSASFPTIEGGGRITLISSPAPGFFKRLVFDQLDQMGGTGA